MSELPRRVHLQDPPQARAREIAHEMLDEIIDLYLAGAELQIRQEVVFVGTQSANALLVLTIRDVPP